MRDADVFRSLSKELASLDKATRDPPKTNRRVLCGKSRMTNLRSVASYARRIDSLDPQIPAHVLREAFIATSAVHTREFSVEPSYSQVYTKGR